MEFNNTKKYKPFRKNKEAICAYVLILPLFIGLVIFYIIPFFKTLFYSFTDLGAFGVYSKVSTENYNKILNDPDLKRALINTFVLTFTSVPLIIIISIILSSLLNANIKGKKFYRVLYLLPAITMPSLNALIWRWLFNSEYGLVNQVISFFSIKGPNWISDKNTALLSVVIVYIWSNIGYNMIIFLAGLKDIPKSYYEAASLDGANSITKFFKITVPLLTPSIFFVLVTTLIKTFQVFDLIFIMITDENVAIKSSQTVVYLFYKYAFMKHDKGYACAIAIMLFIVIMLFTLLQIKLQKKYVNYDYE